MSNLYKLFFAVALILVSTVHSYSTPLSGTYIIGTAANYSTIAAAVADLYTQGISGNVYMLLSPGKYSEQFLIDSLIPGSSYDKKVTFVSQNNDPDGVIINYGGNAGHISNTANIIVKELTFEGSIIIEGIIQDVSIIGNSFNFGGGITQVEGQFTDLTIKGNSYLSSISVALNNIKSVNLNIVNNNFSNTSGFISIESVNSLNISDNQPASINVAHCNNVSVSKNTIYPATDSNDYMVNIHHCDTVSFINNTSTSLSKSVDCRFHFIDFLQILNNTIISKGPSDTTVTIHDNSNSVVKNNIFMNDNNKFTISLNDLTGSFDSDYNNYYNGDSINLIRYNDTVYNTLAQYIAATGNDSHSVSHNTQFVSLNDLHLHPIESGNELLTGQPLAEVTDDIDGEQRNASHPYMGADELDEILPVEITTFVSAVNGNNVSLKWSTSSEFNNFGFEIERSSEYGSASHRTKIGFIRGNGNSGFNVNYSFEDNNLNPGKYSYRLKQIDFNGNINYYELSNEVIIGLPAKYSLSQNYPNPFNPSTKINYSILVSGNVSVKIFDIAGKEVRSLINQFQNAGYYTIDLNAADLSSGQYFYKITAGDFNEVRKMVLVK